MKSLLFIGGTGFLGQSFFDYLNKGKLKYLKLSKIIIISRKNKKIKSQIKITYIKKNIANIKKIPITDYIIYAANSNNSKKDLKSFYNFKDLIDEKHLKTKILFTSSGAVYGPSKYKKKNKEIDLISFNNISKFKGYKKDYAKSKIIIENEFKKLSNKGFKVSIARLFSFIGKRILMNKNFAVTNLINQSLDKKNSKILLNSNMDVYRGYMNADELVRWITKILVKTNSNCKIYNVGSDEATTINELASIIAKKYNKEVLIKNTNKLKQKIDYYVPSVFKAKKELNLKNRFSFKETLNQILNLRNLK